MIKKYKGRIVFVLIFALAALALFAYSAQSAQNALFLFINGKLSKLSPITQDNETYVPVSALKAAGAEVSTSGAEVRIRFEPVKGGTYQTDAVEGRKNEWVFNGIWRVRILDIQPIVDQFNPQRPGWGVTFEFANGSKKAASQFVTGVKYPDLFDTDENKLTIDENDWQTGSWFKELPPGGQVKHTAKFYYPSGTPSNAVRQPGKVLILIDTNDGNFRGTGLKYSSKNPSLRFFLD